MGKLADDMRSDLELRGYARETVQEYLRCMRSFVRFHGKSPLELGEAEVRAFLHHEIAERGLQPNSTRIPIAAIKFFYVHTAERPDVVRRIPFPKQPKPLPEIASPEEVRQLIDAAPSTTTRALLMLGYGAGLRITEARRMRPGDVDSRRHVLKVTAGKGRKDRLTLLPGTLLGELRTYWRERRPQGEWLFPGLRKGSPLSKSAVTDRFDEAYEASGLRRPLTFHSLRHAFATHLLEGGVDVVTIQALLGHANLGTTLRYLRVRADRIEAVTSPLERLYAADLRTDSAA
jgi:site-specific recombinase XerD